MVITDWMHYKYLDGLLDRELYTLEFQLPVFIRYEARNLKLLIPVRFVKHMVSLNSMPMNSAQIICFLCIMNDT